MSRFLGRIRHQFSYARPAKRAGMILLALAAFSVVGTSAWAHWTTHGIGTASASTGTLNAPTNVTVPGTSTGTVLVSWTGSALSNSTAAQGYYVTRIKNSDGSTAAACATSASSLIAGPSCSDPTVPGGAFHYTVTAVYLSWHATSVASNEVTVSTAPTASKLAFTTQPSAAATSQIAFATQPVVTVQDAGGGTVTTDNSSVSLTLTTPAGATLACTTKAKAAVAGIATFAGCQIDKAGTYTLTATNGSLASATSTTVTVTAGSAAAVGVQAGSPQSATVNTAFATALVAKVTDSFGNMVPAVSVTFTAPGAGASGKFVNTTVTTSATTNGAGIATASGFTANTSAGAYTVSASASGATPASFDLTNNPGAAAAMAFGLQPTGTSKGTTVSPAVTVRVLDQFGNLTGSASVSLTLNNPGLVPGAQLQGTTTVNAVNGLATFTTLSVNKAGTFSLNAIVTGLTSVISNNFTMT